MSDYDAFVEKFKPKLTTDDCYTPPAVYDVVLDWVRSEYGISDDVVRPFYPGGDFESVDYSGKVVVDNPPFSIFSKILKFFVERDIPFFLFAPHLTFFNNTLSDKLGFVVCGAKVVYHNGANVNTSFVTNLELNVRTAPDLLARLNDVQGVGKNKRLKYSFSDNVFTASVLGSMCRRGCKVSIPPSKRHFVRVLDKQKEYKKKIFGSGFLVSDEFARVKRGVLPAASVDVDFVWELSSREREIVDSLGGDVVE